MIKHRSTNQASDTQSASDETSTLRAPTRKPQDFMHCCTEQQVLYGQRGSLARSCRSGSVPDSQLRATWFPSLAKLQRPKWFTKGCTVLWNYVAIVEVYCNFRARFYATSQHMVPVLKRRMLLPLLLLLPRCICRKLNVTWPQKAI